MIHLAHTARQFPETVFFLAHEGGADYIPVSCEFHDRLEDLATLRKQAAVSYLDDDGAPQQRSAVIKDVFAREGADYLTLSSGETLRLDRLVEVDGYKLADFPPHCEL